MAWIGWQILNRGVCEKDLNMLRTYLKKKKTTLEYSTRDPRTRSAYPLHCASNEELLLLIRCYLSDALTARGVGLEALSGSGWMI